MSDTIRYGNFQEMYSSLRYGKGVIELEKAKKNSKGVKVKLVDAIDEEQIVNLPLTNDNGKRVYRPIKFIPNTLYLAPKGDSVFIETLMLRGKVKKAYSEKLEKALKDADIPHEVIKCKSCGGRVTKIEVQRFEVIGE